MSTPTVADSLRLAHGVDPSEFDHVVAVMARLDSRLRSFPAGTVELELSVKERDTPSQRTTLEAWIAGQTRLVATSNRPGFDAALQEVRDDLDRQITDTRERAEAQNSNGRPDTW